MRAVVPSPNLSYHGHLKDLANLTEIPYANKVAPIQGYENFTNPVAGDK